MAFTMHTGVQIERYGHQQSSRADPPSPSANEKNEENEENEQMGCSVEVDGSICKIINQHQG